MASWVSYFKRLMRVLTYLLVNSTLARAPDERVILWTLLHRLLHWYLLTRDRVGSILLNRKLRDKSAHFLINISLLLVVGRDIRLDILVLLLAWSLLSQFLSLRALMLYSVSLSFSKRILSSCALISNSTLARRNKSSKLIRADLFLAYSLLTKYYTLLRILDIQNANVRAVALG